MKIKTFRTYRLHSKYSKKPHVPNDVEDIADMLRYNTAFINIKHPGVVLYVTFGGQSLKVPTHERWNSFGYILEPVELEGAQEGIPDIGNWFTFQHPPKPGYGTNYSALERVNLKTFLEARDIEAVRRHG